MDGWLSGPGAYLRSGAEMAEIFARYPGVGGQSIEIADQCAFNLRLPNRGFPNCRSQMITHRSAGYGN